MILNDLGLVIPTEPHTTLQSAVNAAYVNPRYGVWIPAWYKGTDSYTNPHNVPVFDLRGSGSFSASSSPAINPTIVALAPSLPGAFIVAHGFGATPKVVVINMNSGGGIYFQNTPYDGTNLYLVATDGGVTGNAVIVA